jgi:hypothetical protein
VKIYRVDEEAPLEVPESSVSHQAGYQGFEWLAAIERGS